MMTDEQQKRLYELVARKASWATLLGGIIKGMITDEDPEMRALGRALQDAAEEEAERQRNE